MNEVTLKLDEYRKLVLDQAALAIILKALYQNARLYYNKEQLALDMDSVNEVLKLIDREHYYGIFDTLLDIEKEKEKDSMRSESN